MEEPAQMLLIKNDPEYNESWPRALVPYKRIYGIAEPKRLVPLANDGSLSKHLARGTPFGLVGTSSLCKRESFPNGRVPEGKVTAAYAGGNDPWRGLDAFTSHGNGMPLNFHNQGGDVGLYNNDDIHAIRILALEPTTDRQRGANSGRRFYNHATERMRILGEIPVRKFSESGQPKDPDGNPDTSFLAKIPADTAFTFQTLDKRGMVLNSAQTWHQLRPGEIRNNCGGCHAHSQQPTDFNQTAAARPDYKVWDLVSSTPLVTTRSRDESKLKWDEHDETGLRYVKREKDHGVLNVEYWRDIKPILQRSCVACHSSKDGDLGSAGSGASPLTPGKREGGNETPNPPAAPEWQPGIPAGNLNLDADDELVQYEQHGKFPGTYYRLALDERAKFGYKPIGYDSWGYPNASRYIRKMQSRRSLIIWKIFGERLDGFSNDDHPSEPEPGAGYFAHKGQHVPTDKNRHRYDLDFVGKMMPPPDSVVGKFKGPNGQLIKVAPLTEEDRFTFVRWIDLGCPIDLDYDPRQPDRRGFGWMLDDNRPILTLTTPHAGANSSLEDVLIGLHDYYTGLDMESFSVTADFPLNGFAPGQNLAAGFRQEPQGVWELKLASPIKELAHGTLTVSIKDRQGNTSRLERTFSVGGEQLSASNK